MQNSQRLLNKDLSKLSHDDLDIGSNHVAKKDTKELN